jgi:hypothetical protein
MQGNDRDAGGAEYTSAEGLALALNYLSDPADVPCPTCGPGTIEVVAYLDAGGIEEGVVRAASPEGDYTVVLYCHDCKRAAALDLSPDSLPEEFGGTGEGGGEPFGDSSDDRWAA